MDERSGTAGLIAEGGSRGIGVIIASCLGVGIGLLGLPIMTIGVFVGPLAHDFGWSRYQIAGASLCINLATLLTAPVIGRVCDKAGIRRVAMVSIVALAAGYFCLSAMHGALGTYYLTWLLMAAAGVGTSGIVWSKAVSGWYSANRGLALGVTMAGTALAAIFGPLLLAVLVQAQGWRAGYQALGFTTLLLAPLTYALLFERQDPEGRAGHVRAAALPGLTFGEAIGRASFWKLGIGLFFVVLGMGSMLVHFVPLAIDAGMPPTTAAALYSVLGLAMLFARVAVGWMLDRLKPTLVAGIVLALPAVSCLLLSLCLADRWVFVLSATILGLCAGAEINLLAFMTARYFGMRAFAAIYGCELAFFSAGSGLGGVLTGFAHDVTGSYQLALRIGIFVFLLGAAIVASMGNAPRFASLSGD